MQYWVAIDGQKQGPMELEQLLTLNITPETLVWREGLSAWIKAKDLSELSSILMPHAEVVPPTLPEGAPEVSTGPSCCYEQPTQPKFEQPACQVGQIPPSVPAGTQYNQAPPQMPVCPQNHLAFAIITMLCCCQIFGIVALVYSLQVSSLYSQGNYAGAQKASDNAKMWSIIALVAGLIITPIVIALGVFDSLWAINF